MRKKAPVDGDIPTGMTYNQSVGTITGTPKKAGVFVFYINGIKYQITVEKQNLPLQQMIIQKYTEVQIRHLHLSMTKRV